VSVGSAARGQGERSDGPPPAHSLAHFLALLQGPPFRDECSQGSRTVCKKVENSTFIDRFGDVPTTVETNHFSFNFHCNRKPRPHLARKGARLHEDGEVPIVATVPTRIDAVPLLAQDSRTKQAADGSSPP
jgi:hypothetical protein